MWIAFFKNSHYTTPITLARDQKGRPLEIYESQSRQLLRRLTSRDRSKWPLSQVTGAINQLLVTHPRARLYGKWESLGNLLNDIRAALSLGDTVTVLPGCSPKAERSKGPRKHAVTIPYLAGVFLRSRYGDNWTGELVEQDWLDFALAQGYDAARVKQARAQLTAIFHGIRGWVETETSEK